MRALAIGRGRRPVCQSGVFGQVWKESAGNRARRPFPWMLLSTSCLPPRKTKIVALLAQLRMFSSAMPRTSVHPQHLDALRKFKAEVFQALAHPTRIHIIETLADGELSVGAILACVKVEAANLSQHLAVLRSRNLVTTRKDGNQVLYSVRDPLLIEALDVMRRYFQRHFEEAIAILKNMEEGR
jgi:ArsR family transcriptional regulator